MLADVRNRDEAAWNAHAKLISVGMRRELVYAPTGDIYDQLMREQVKLIKSLPLEAAGRVHDIATGLLFKGERPDRLMAEILRTGEVTEARARLIARTETSRAASNFMQARAQWVGSEGYIWRGVRDMRERTSHYEMEGKYVRWTTPPTLDGLTGHAGCLPNCRCWAEPVLPDLDYIT